MTHRNGPNPLMIQLFCWCLLGLCLPPWALAAPPAVALPQGIDLDLQRIHTAALQSPRGMARLTELCDTIGHRLAGSVALEQAVLWAVAGLHADGQTNVRAEPVQVRAWKRGNESLQMLQPRSMPLTMIGLGNSSGTGPQGITAQLLVVSDEADLQAHAAEAKGKIVLFDNAMAPWSREQGSGYGKAVRFRSGGRVLAGKLGAVAVLVRSVTAHSLNTPHTGATQDGPEVPAIAAAAVTVEHAQMLHRLAALGPVRLHLTMDAHFDADRNSANVLAEIQGYEHPEEIVVIGGHLDSWDVGQGAHDDGAGVVHAMEALRIIRQLGLKPRRTIRVVLWTNEENGLAGARAYALAHAHELANTVAAIESDAGGFSPVGLGIEVTETVRDGQGLAVAQLQRLLNLIAIPQFSEVNPGQAGADTSPLLKTGVPGLELLTDGAHYFDYHHTAADTVDKVDPQQLQRGIDALASVAYVLAQWPGRLSRP